jgi:hypothetical protein
MIVPQVILQNYIKTLIDFLQEDSTKVDEENTFLHHLLNFDDNGNKIKYGKFNYLEVAKGIFSRDEEDRKKLEIFIGYNRARTDGPTIHIILSNESTASSGIGDNLGFQDNEVTTDGTEVYENFTENFSTTYTLVVTSNVSNEVLVIYEVIKACFKVTKDNLESLGLQNVSFYGTDFVFQQELMPVDVTHKSLSLRFTYDLNVPSIASQKLLKHITVQSKAI